MGLATGNTWTGSLFGADIDGVDQWDAMTKLSTNSPRNEIVHYHDGENVSSIQIDMWKLNLGDSARGLVIPEYTFTTDLNPELSNQICTNPSLMNELSSYMKIMNLFSHPYKTMSLKTKSTNRNGSSVQNEETQIQRIGFFNKQNSVILLAILLTLVFALSIRLATVLKEDTEPFMISKIINHKLKRNHIHSTTSYDKNDKNSGGRIMTETSKLLV